MTNNTTMTASEVEAALMRENALRGNAATVLARYHRARTRLAYLRLAAVDPAALMAGGKLPSCDDKEMQALTPAALHECAAQAMEYLQSLLPK